jgi:hypothetical protein
MLGAVVGLAAVALLSKRTAGSSIRPQKKPAPKKHVPKGASPQGVGRVPSGPTRGSWGGGGFPSSVQLSDGSTFNRSHYSWPLYSGVQAQYREAVPFFSRHLLVYNDNTFEITHADEYNPDMGYPVEHLAVDAPEALAAGLAIAGFGAGLLGGLWLLEP